MTLTTSSFIEHYLTLLAWVINNGIFSILRDTSIAAWPIAGIILGEWLRARGEGADEGNKALLSVYRIENRVYVAYIVILFAFIPAVKVDLATLQVDKSREVDCVTKKVEPAKTGIGQEFEQSIGGRQARIPVWWAMVHALSRGVTRAAVVAIPCKPDIRAIKMEIDSTRINDKLLLAEFSEFDKNCYGKARLKFNTEQPPTSVEKDLDTSWVGSNYFLKTAGYYDSMQSDKPVKGWTYNPTRDAGKAPSEGGWGYPGCKEWWSDPKNGIRARLLKHVNPTTGERVKAFFKFWSNETAQDYMLYNIMSPKNMSLNMSYKDIVPDYSHQARSYVGGFLSFFGGLLNNSATAAGLVSKSPSAITGLNALKVALPMIQAFLLMAVVVCIPILLVLGKYSLPTVMAITFGIFALHFCSFWWELARWIDASLFSALTGGLDTVENIKEAGNSFSTMGAALGPLSDLADGSVTALVMQFVMAALFFVLPMMFFAMMGWAGVQVGTALGGIITTASGSSQQAGAAGGQAAMNVAKTAVSAAANIATGGVGMAAKGAGMAVRAGEKLGGMMRRT